MLHINKPFASLHHLVWNVYRCIQLYICNIDDDARSLSGRSRSCKLAWHNSLRMGVVHVCRFYRYLVCVYALYKYSYVMKDTKNNVYYTFIQFYTKIWSYIYIHTHCSKVAFAKRQILSKTKLWDQSCPKFTNLPTCQIIINQEKLVSKNLKDHQPIIL